MQRELLNGAAENEIRACVPVAQASQQRSFVEPVKCPRDLLICVAKPIEKACKMAGKCAEFGIRCERSGKGM